MKNNNNWEELNEFDTNIAVISFTDTISKLIMGVGIDEKDDVIKQIKAIRILKQLKMWHYANMLYKYWSH